MVAGAEKNETPLEVLIQKNIFVKKLTGKDGNDTQAWLEVFVTLGNVTTELCASLTKH